MCDERTGRYVADTAQPFEIAARSRSMEPDRAQFRHYQASHVLPWSAEERHELTELVGSIRVKLARFKVTHGVDRFWWLCVV